MILALAVLMAACGRPDDQTTESLDPVEALRRREEMPAQLREQLDSGSAAFRAADMQGALDHYTAATQIDPEAAAAWFGVYMAQKAMGNATEALAALERVQELAPGATLVHPSEGDTSR